MQDTVNKVSSGQHSTDKTFKVPPSAHSSVSVWVLIPWPHCFFFPPHSLALFFFFLPFRIGMGQPWNCQASSCLISSVKFKLASDLYTYTTWLRICGISVNVRISETGKEISVYFESIHMTKSDHPKWYSESLCTTRQAQVHIKVSTALSSCKSLC